MTWLRWDTDTPRSSVVALLANDLGVHLMQATGHYFAAVSGFGDHQPDGSLDAVPDLSIEQWAGWTGKRGRFAAAFRTHCRADGTGEDPEGCIRGWWRQRALIEKREKDATRRKPARVSEKTPDEPACYVITSRSVPSEGLEKKDAPSGKHAKLIALLPPDSHTALDGLLRASPNPTALLGELEMIPERVRGAGWADVGIALRDIVLAGAKPTGLTLCTFTRKAMDMRVPASEAKLPRTVNPDDAALARLRARDLADAR